MRHCIAILAILLFAGCATTTKVQPAATAADTPSPNVEVHFDELWDYNNPAQTEERFQSLLADYPATTAPLMRAELLTQIARTHSLRGAFEAAHRHLDNARTLLTDGNSTARIRLHLERGRTYNSAGDKAQAHTQFLRSFRLACSLKSDFYAIDAAHMLAIVSPAPAAMEWNLLALDMALQSKMPLAQRWQGSLLNNLGWTFFDAKEYQKALDLFKQALAFRQQQGKAGAIRIARWCIARTLRALGQYGKALNILQQLDAELQQAKERDGFVYEELAECHLALGNADRARYFAAQAFRELSQMKWFVSSEAQRLQRMKTLSEAAQTGNTQ